MWTAKRILIFVVGFVVCLSGFTIYALALGNIDGLRALPIEYLSDPNARNQDPVSPPPGGPDQRLEQAFGVGCKQMQRPLRLWLPDKGVVFSAGDFQLDKDGRVRLAPFSAALYHKSKIPGEFPEISAIDCDVAIFTLDQPATSIGDLNNRKVIAVEMVGRQPGITITNNRRTAEKNDDIDILITNGNLFYEERKNLIWTEGVVRLTDNQSKPPTMILGTGMDMFMAKDSGPNQKKAKPRPAQPSHDTGDVKKIRLRADVHMHFWVDAGSGFLGGAEATRKPLQRAAKPATPEKAHIHIHTSGPFEYDLTKETAWFESPPVRKNGIAAGDQDWPGQVLVERFQHVNGVKTEDRLVCDRLDLQFRVATRAPGGTGGNKEIETAKATKRNLTDVTLALESHKMHAFASEMFYQAGTNDGANGPSTKLYGEPQRLIRASKDGHKIRCTELHLFAANRFGDGQKALAMGPGQIDLLDTKDLEKESFPSHLLWRDTLTVAKAKEGGEVFDLMTVLGEASFIDDVQKQELHGERIDLWLKQVQEGEKKADAVGGGKTELHRVIALERVRAISPEFVIRQTDRFTMVFTHEVPRGTLLPDGDVVKVKPQPAPKKEIKPQVGKDGPEPKPALVEIKPTVAEKKPNRPIELTATEVFARVATLGGQKQLQELIAKGNVHVFQAGEKAGEKALDITGQLLTVKGGERGRTMVVYGEKDKLARLDLGDTTLWGPRVTINQADNRTDIEGHGAMEMPSNKTLDGNDTAKKDTRIRIYWNKNMTFDGKYALFHGGVQAHEVGSHAYVKCEVLHTILDKTVSFKDGQKDKQSAKIDRLVFDKNVFVDDTKVDEKKQFVQRTILEGREMINYQDGPTRLVGPGEVRLLAKGSGELGPAPMPAANNNAGPKKTEWKLTNVKFRDHMLAEQKPEVKTATFYGYSSGVEVFHFATVDINAKMNADKPPKDGLYLRCEILTVEERKIGDRVSQTMIAKQNVIFKTDKYFGRADIMKYDEAKDVIILEAAPGNVVQLYQLENNQPNPGTVNSTKVLYNRKTGEIRSEGVKSLTN
ncbi:MAG: hypothetical protein EXR98_10730 [Gemmataceae bacterium]|nr:hypothetical protein [Gemmataceae bacterium]